MTLCTQIFVDFFFKLSQIISKLFLNSRFVTLASIPPSSKKRKNKYILAIIDSKKPE